MRLRAEPLDRVLSRAVEAGRVSGLVAGVADRDGPLYVSAAGLARTGAPRRMATDTVFRVASLAKPITTLAVLMLREVGALDLEAPLSDYLPGYRQPGVLESFDERTLDFTTRESDTAITLRHLLTHTSGYGYWFLHRPLRLLARGEPRVFEPPFLVADPGRRFAYSVSTDVLGQIIAPVSGLPLGEYLRRRVFLPLGMPDTGWAPPGDLGRLASVHQREDGGLAERPDEAPVVEPRGGGSLFSTVPDYLRLLQLLLRDGELDGVRLVRPDAVEAMCRNQIGDLKAEVQTTADPNFTNDFIFMDGTQQFGFGLMIETRPRDSGRPTGTASWGGILNTYFWIDRRTGIAGVVMMQVRPFADPDCLQVWAGLERAVYDQLGV